jgi:hypothetical protein
MTKTFLQKLESDGRERVQCELKVHLYRLAVEASYEIGLKLYGLRNSGASG